MELIDVIRDKDKKAKFSHFCAGNLYYTVDVDGIDYQFCVNATYAEVGTATFNAEEPIRLLQRYIRISMEKDEFIRVSKNN